MFADASMVSKQLQSAMIEKASEAAELRSRLLDLEQSMECQICLNNQASVAFDCGHCYCGAPECGSSNVTECPACRKQVEKRTQLFGANDALLIVKSAPAPVDTQKVQKVAGKLAQAELALVQTRLRDALRENWQLKDKLQKETEEKEAVTTALTTLEDEVKGTLLAAASNVQRTTAMADEMAALRAELAKLTGKQEVLADEVDSEEAVKFIDDQKEKGKREREEISVADAEARLKAEWEKKKGERCKHSAHGPTLQDIWVSQEFSIKLSCTCSVRARSWLKRTVEELCQSQSDKDEVWSACGCGFWEAARGAGQCKQMGSAFLLTHGAESLPRIVSSFLRQLMCVRPVIVLDRDKRGVVVKAMRALVEHSAEHTHLEQTAADASLKEIEEFWLWEIETGLQELVDKGWWNELELQKKPCTISLYQSLAIDTVDDEGQWVLRLPSNSSILTTNGRSYKKIHLEMPTDLGKLGRKGMTFSSIKLGLRGGVWRVLGGGRRDSRLFGGGNGFGVAAPDN